MGRVQQGEEAYTQQVYAGAAAKKVENKKKTNLQNNIDYHTATREDGYKLDIDIVINRPGDIKRDNVVLHEKYINKDGYTEKVDALSNAIQGELVCYEDEENILKKVVENSNSQAFQTGDTAQVTLADVERAYYDQDDINLNIVQTQNDMEDDLSVFGKYNRNLKRLKFLTKLKMLMELANTINGEEHKIWGPKNEDVSALKWLRETEYSVEVDDRYVDKIKITISYVDDKENGNTKKVITRTTTRYVKINIEKYYNQLDKGLFGSWVTNTILDKYDIKYFENMFVYEGKYNFKDRIEYLKDPDVVD